MSECNFFLVIVCSKKYSADVRFMPAWASVFFSFIYADLWLSESFLSLLPHLKIILHRCSFYEISSERYKHVGTHSHSLDFFFFFWKGKLYQARNVTYDGFSLCKCSFCSPLRGQSLGNEHLCIWASCQRMLNSPSGRSRSLKVQRNSPNNFRLGQDHVFVPNRVSIFINKRI